MQDNIVIFTSKQSSDKQKVVIENVKGGIKKNRSPIINKDGAHEMIDLRRKTYLFIQIANGEFKY